MVSGEGEGVDLSSSSTLRWVGSRDTNISEGRTESSGTGEEEFKRIGNLEMWSSSVVS